MILISTENVPKAEQHGHAHSLLSLALKKFGIAYTLGDTPVVYGECGKPSLAEHPEIHFNISHADGIAAVTVSEHECGIDCERVRAYDQRVMKRVCTAAEQAAISSAPENERDMLFFRLWTLKEAYVKALGKGLSFPLRKAAFMFEGDEILTELSGCAFSQYVINGEFAAAVCELSAKHRQYRLHYLQVSDGATVMI